MSARKVSPSTRATVSGVTGRASRPRAAQSIGGGGTSRRLTSSARDGTRRSLPMSTAPPLASPPPRKKSRRALSGAEIRAAPSPRAAMSGSCISQRNTTRRDPGGSDVSGRFLGTGAPWSGGRRGAQAAPRPATTAIRQLRHASRTQAPDASFPRRAAGMAAGRPDASSDTRTVRAVTSRAPVAAFVTT
jgi:hypothetical protein